MRILVHDFGGFSFPIQLSRELARTGHNVDHVYPIGLEGPKGRLVHSEADSARLTIRGVHLSGTFRKYSAWRRLAAQRQYARELKELISREKPDVVLSGNTPIDVQAELLWHCSSKHVGFVHWVQDVYCYALEFYLRGRIGALSRCVSFPFYKLEQSVARRSTASVVISRAFGDLLSGWGVPVDRVHVFENWAPLNEINDLPRDNAWGERYGLGDKTVFLYSGTLGLKHRPDLLYELAKAVDERCKVVVISEGVGRQYLERLPELPTLLLLDFLPYEQVQQALASADVLVAVLDSDASAFAVPSKILSYLCAGRPLLFVGPKDNLAARVVESSRSGVVVDPTVENQLQLAAKMLASNAPLRASLGRHARQHAESNFDIASIAASFERVLVDAGRQSRPPPTLVGKVQPEI